MRLEQLQYVIEIAKYHSMQKAAESLHITQPNLSLSIKQLEEEIDTIIFTRSKKGSYLTEQGKEVYKTACRILYDVSTLYSNKNTETITGSLNILAAVGFTELLNQISNILLMRFPKIKQHIKIWDAEDINQLLNTQHDKSIIFTALKTEDLFNNSFLFKNYHLFNFSQSQLCVLASEHSPLAKKKTISFSTLKKLPLAYYTTDNLSDESYTLRIIESYNIPLSKALATNDMNAITKYIQAGLAYGLMTTFPTKTHALDGCVLIPLKEKITISFIMLIDNANFSKPAYKAYLEIIQSMYPNIIDISSQSSTNLFSH